MHNSNLENELARYNEQSRQAVKSRTTKFNPGKLLSYTAAASSAFVFSATADAAVIYSGVQNLSSDNVVDINSDGTNDFAFTISSFNGFSTYAGAYLNPLAGAEFIKTGAFDVKKLASGSSISAGANFLDVEGAFRYVVIDSVGDVFEEADWQGAVAPNTTSGFAGVKINDNGTDIFGWLRFSVENSPLDGTPVKVTLIDWAYEDTGAAILAGQTSAVPLPGSLGLLAMGASGIAAFRRRKNGDQAKK